MTLFGCSIALPHVGSTLRSLRPNLSAFAMLQRIAFKSAITKIAIFGCCKYNGSSWIIERDHL